MEIKPKHIEIAELLVDQNLSTDKVGKKIGINGRTIRRWMEEKNGKEFQDLVDQLLQTKINFAKRLAKCYANESVKNLKRISAGNDEAARKACINLLELTGEFKFDQKGDGSGQGGQVINIYNHIPGMITQSQEKENGNPKSRL